MSIAIVVTVSEGLVLGADSAATLTGRAINPSGVEEEGVLKTYYHAKKLLQVGNFPIGVLTWGLGHIGLRTIESLVREWEYNEHWQSPEDHKNNHGTDNARISIKDCADSLRAHLNKVYAETEEFRSVPAERRPGLGVVVAGYSEREFFPEIWRFAVPFDETVVNPRPNREGQPDFGAAWFGLTDAIVRLHWGRDDVALKVISEKFGISEDELNAILQPLQYQIPFAVMPLQDAIDYAYYMLNVTLGRYRFAIGPELCGGQIEIAAITQGEFNWISRKSWKLEQRGG